MTTYREGLLAAARVCEAVWREQNKEWVRGGTSYHDGGVDAAEECERRILALAEQEDQRGAAATCTEGASSETGESQNRASDGKLEAQSAPHPDPAGQEVALPAVAPDPGASVSESAAPALPGPETVSVPIERVQQFLRTQYTMTANPAYKVLDDLEHWLSAMLAAGSAK